MLHSEVTFKSMKVTDDNLQNEWVKYDYHTYVTVEKTCQTGLTPKITNIIAGVDVDGKLFTERK